MAMEAISEAQSIVMLRSSDNKMFQVEKGVACELIAVRNMIEDTGMDQPIPLPNVSSNILAKVIEYCKYHVDNRRKALSEQRQVAAADNVVKAWDQDFINVDQGTLFDLILVRKKTSILFSFFTTRNFCFRCKQSRDASCDTYIFLPDICVD